MDVRQLRYFIGVFEAGSFTAAAHRLGVAQPALSQTVIALENDLGVELLERQPRGVRPTAAGMTLLDHAHIVLRNIERAREAASEPAAMSAVAWRSDCPRRLPRFSPSH